MRHIENDDDLLTQEIKIESESKVRREKLEQIEKERQEVIEQRQEIVQERLENVARAHQAEAAKGKYNSSGLMTPGCLMILSIIAIAIFWLIRSSNVDIETELSSQLVAGQSFSDNSAEQQADLSVDIRALERTVYDWIRNHEHYDVSQLSLSRTDIPLHYEGTITWNRYGRSFTNMIVVQYFLENGGMTWHVDESQEELDYVAAIEGGEAIFTLTMVGTINGEPAHLYIESSGAKVVGFYYFDSEGIQRKRNLGGEYDKSSSHIRLLETNADDATIAVFEGLLNSSSTYTGSYTNILNNVNEQFEFHKTSN